MNEFKPDNLRGEKPLSPEEIEAARKMQEAANELLNAKEAVPKPSFRPDYGKDEHADEVRERVMNGGVKVEMKPAETEEGDLPRIELEKLQRDPLAWVHESISNQKLGANDKMKGLIEAMEQEQKKKAA
jgi:hypothetical protein